MTMVCTIEATSHINYGVIFEPESMVKFSTQSWIHSFIFDVPAASHMALIPPCTLHSYCNHKNQIINDINKLRRHVIDSFNATYITATKMVLEQQTDSQRPKKAIFSFLGDALNFLTGTATDSELEQINGHINNLKKAMSNLNELYQKQSKSMESFTKIVNKRFNNVMTGLEQNKNATIKLAIDTTRAIDKQAENFRNTMSLMTEELNNMAYLNQYANDVTIALIDIAQNKLSPTLVSYDELQRTILGISDTLQRHFNDYDLVTKDPHFYYKYGKFQATRHLNKVIITIKFPLSDKSTYTLYKVHTFPSLTNNKDETSHATQLLNISDYFVLEGNQQKFTELTTNEAAMCQGTDIRICNFQPTFSFLQKDNCIANLFLDNRQKIKQFCDFRYLPQTITPHFQYVGQNNVIIYRIDKIILSCRNGHRRTVQGCTYCIFQVPCGCTLSTDDILFQNHITGCDNTDITPTKVYPINLALLQNFFDDKKVNEILANSTFDSPADIILPQLDIYKHEMEHTIATDKTLDFNLTTIATQMKTDSKIYTSLTDAYLNGEIDRVSNGLFDYRLIILIISIILTVCNSVILLITIRKVRALTALCLLLRPVKALQQFNYPTTKPDPAIADNILKAIKLEHITTFLCATTVILLAFIIIIWASNRPTTNTQLSIEVSNGSKCTLVPIFTLPLCEEYYNIQYPETVGDLSINGFIYPSLAISWPNFMVTDIASQRTIRIPSQIKIKPWTALRLRRIIDGTFFLKIRIIHNGVTYIKRNPIELPPYQDINMDALD